MKEYEINETIPKVTGEKVYCINKKVGEMFGTPIIKEVYRGTKEECEKYLEELQK